MNKTISKDPTLEDLVACFRCLEIYIGTEGRFGRLEDCFYRKEGCENLNPVEGSGWPGTCFARMRRSPLTGDLICAHCYDTEEEFGYERRNLEEGKLILEYLSSLTENDWERIRIQAR